MVTAIGIQIDIDIGIGEKDGISIPIAISTGRMHPKWELLRRGQGKRI